MPNFHLRLSSPHYPLNRLPNILVWPLFGYVVECTHFPLNKVKWNYNLSMLRNWSPPLAFAGSVPRLHSLGALNFSTNMEVSDIGMCCQSIVSTDSSEKQILRKEVQEINICDFPKSLSKDDKERQRREKIGLANKGRLPWNKGRKHSAETRERIKQRTIEALRNPKVRKRMSERPRSHRRLSSPHYPLNRLPNILVWPLFGYAVECTHFPLNKVKWNYNLSVLRNWSPPLAFAGSVPRLHSLGALNFSTNMEVSDIGMCCQSIVSTDSSEKQILRKEVQEINICDFPKSLSKDDKERQRREKIGLANKGRLPWNKGRKHSAETRERIKQRTIEALRNPKVRKRMSERPRSHSDQVKEKIGSALRRIWGKRLKWKRLKDKLFQSWAESIAEAAKTGGSEQEMLDWDSYDTLKQDLIQQQLMLATKKAKAKEMAKIIIKAEKQAQARAEKAEKLAHKQKKDAEKANENRKSNGNKEELKLKQRLTKIRPKISTNVQFSSPGTVISHIPSCDKLDLELIKRERLQREVSLADQIRAAKNKKAEFAAMEALTPSSYAHQFSDTPRE